jgi:predicted PurR-regulated permease PerM
MTSPKDTKTKARRHDRPARSSWRSADILRAASIVAALLIILKVLWVANQIVIVVFLGSLFGIAVAAGVDKLERFRVNRGLGAAFVVISFLAVLYALGSFVAPTIAEQGRELKRQLPEAASRAEKWLSRRNPAIMSSLLGTDSVQGATGDTTRAAIPPGAPAAGDSTAAHDTSGTHAPQSAIAGSIAKRMGGAAKFLFPFITSTFEVIAGLVLILMMSVYIGADPFTYRNGILHLFPKRKRERINEVLTAMAVMLRKWLVTQLIAMAVIGVVSTIALLVLGVKAPFALGIIAGLLEFVPTFGPVLSAIPAIAMGFLDSPEKALYVALTYIAIQQIENHLLIPLLMKGGMDLPPVLTIVTQGLMALLFGFLGLMIAVPLLAAVLVPIKMLYVEDALGDQIGLEDDDEPDEGPLRDG